jgi:hypothetical protein
MLLHAERHRHCLGGQVWPECNLPVKVSGNLPVTLPVNLLVTGNAPIGICDVRGENGRRR